MYMYIHFCMCVCAIQLPGLHYEAGRIYMTWAQRHHLFFGFQTRRVGGHGILV